MPEIKRVLVVDDEPAIAWVLASTLQGRGHHVKTSHNGRDVLALARSHRPDVVVLDVMMPEMDGFRVLEALRSDPETAEVRVLLMSAGFDPRVRQRARDEGVAFLEKPFDWTRMVQCVESLPAEPQGLSAK
jgi:CheY-like chemotaxis protein